MRVKNPVLRPAARLLLLGGILFLCLGLFLTYTGRPVNAAAGVTVSPRGWLPFRAPAQFPARQAAQDIPTVQFNGGDETLCQFEAGPVTATGSYHVPAGYTARLQLHYYVVHPTLTATEYIDAGLVTGDGEFTITRNWPGVALPYSPGDVVEIHFGAVLLDPAANTPISYGAGKDFYWYEWVCTPTPTAVASDTLTATLTESPTPTVTQTGSPGQEDTFTPTLTQTDPSGQENTFTPTPTNTRRPSRTPTLTVTSTRRPSRTPTLTATVTQTSLPGQEDTFTPSPTATASQTLTVTLSQTASLTLTPSVTQTNSSGQQDTLTPTPTVTASQTLTVTPSLTASPTLTVTQTGSPGQEDTFTPTPTASKTLTVMPSPTPTATFTLPPIITITNTLTPTLTPRQTATLTATQTATVTSTAQPNLVLESLCGYRVENQQSWRLTNSSSFAVDFMWQATATGETGSGSVPANSQIYLITSGPAQNLRIYVGGLLVKEVSSAAGCLDYLELATSCTVDNQLAWIVFNRNPYPVNVFWTLDNAQTGSGSLSANSAGLVTMTGLGQHSLSLSWTYPPLGQRTITLASSQTTCAVTLTPSITASLPAGTASPTATNTLPPQPGFEVTPTRLPTLAAPIITSTPILIPVTGADYTSLGSLALLGRILTNLGLLFVGAALLIWGALLRSKS